MKLLVSVLLSSIIFSAAAQDGPKPFIITGTEIPIASLPNLKGSWINNYRSNKWALDNGVYATWIGGKCGQDFRTVLKAYKQADVLIIQTGPSKDLIRCSEESGMFLKINTTSKSGTYHLKATKDSQDIRFEGILSLD